MTIKQMTGGFGVVFVAFALSACAAEPSDVGEAPELADDDGVISPADEGTTYDGWTQYADTVWQQCMGNWAIRSNFTRSWGDNTRGGGACFVRATGASCSSDASCISAATAQYSAGWGYCYQGQCYTRPGAGSTYCTTPNPNRSPGWVWTNPYFWDTVAFPNGYPDGAEYALGCMTKGAGPNGSCGCTTATCGSNYTSLYMRTVRPLDWEFSACGM